MLLLTYWWIDLTRASCNSSQAFHGKGEIPECFLDCGVFYAHFKSSRQPPNKGLSLEAVA
jgi:hypothetical protein